MVYFKDYPKFKPNLTPRDIFRLGSFGGTYWRPIYSSITGKNYSNQHKKYKWNIPENMLTSEVCYPELNKYGVNSGTSLDNWEKNGWIVNNLIDDVNCTALSIGEDYLKEYYIVDSTNRFILLDKFSINLKELATQKEIKISNCSSHKIVSVLTNSSHIPHVHTVGYKNEDN